MNRPLLSSVLAIFLSMLVVFSAHAESELDMVVLVDRTEASSDLVSQRRAEIAREAVTEAAPLLARMGEELSENGYVLASQEEIDRARKWLKIATRTSVDAIENLGFDPVNLSRSEFDRAELRGVGGTYSKDGLVHRLYYRFSHPELGLVMLEEYSFATDPDTVRLTVSRPLGNIWINGLPGTAFALSTPEGTAGRTTVKYFTESKMYSLHVFRTIPIDSEAFAGVERLAQALQ